MEGSSIGGGKIIISRINDYEVGINGEKPTLLIEHEDKPGVIGRVTTLLGTNQINIAEMKVFRSGVGSDKLMVLETDQDVTDSILSNIFNMQDVIDALKIEPV
jgi:L-serine dehydratase